MLQTLIKQKEDPHAYRAFPSDCFPSRLAAAPPPRGSRSRPRAGSIPSLPEKLFPIPLSVECFYPSGVVGAAGAPGARGSTTVAIACLKTICSWWLLSRMSENLSKLRIRPVSLTPLNR